MNVGTLGRTALLLGIGFVSGIALTIFSMDETGWWQGEVKPEPGATLFEADINEVRSFTYTTNALMLTAQRSKAGEPLAIQVTYADNRAPQHCISTPELGGVLTSFARSKVKKRITPKEIKLKYPVALGDIEVKDAVTGEPIAPWRLFTTNDYSGVAVDKRFEAFELDISLAALKRLQAGCAELARR